MKCIVLVLTFVSLSVVAQPVDHQNYSVEYKEPSPQGFFFFNASAGVADKQYRRAMDGHAFGMSTGFGFNPLGPSRSSPFLLGVDFSAYSFGGDDTTDPVTDIDYRTSYNTSFTGLLARVYPLSLPTVNFFVDGVAGLRNIGIRTREDVYNSEEALVVHKLNDRSFGYGVGIGLHGKRAKSDNDEPRLSVLARVVHLWGERSSYLERESVRVTNGDVTFRSGFTATGMWQIQLGVILY